MSYMNYIIEHALILIPALIIIGMIIKQTDIIPDKYIPLVLLGFGLVGAAAILGFTVEAVIQGILVTGAAVYGSQLVKQLRKSE